jgi:phosphoribosylformylglycinamidine cyclo-ligase
MLGSGARVEEARMGDSETGKPRGPGIRYRDAGVQIDLQEEALRRIRPLVASARTAGVLADVGAFGGMFDPDLRGFDRPVLVASCDGVGTKLRVAFETGIHDTVGRDLVNHCVNDILVQGAIPLFFLDYLATGQLDPSVLAAVVSGIARGCRENGCALLGGETAEMPGFYASGEYDLAGFIVGVVDRSRIVDGSGIRPGDLLVGLRSCGLHTNGYSLARKILFEVAGFGVDTALPELGETVGQALLREHRSYLGALRKPLGEGLVRGLAHITGGGLTDNLPRILPEGTAARIVKGSWPVPPIFELLAKLGPVEEEEMFRTFNMGIGMVAVVSPERVSRFESLLEEAGEPHERIGTIVPGDRAVLYV